jgi:hypothetical protein
MGMKNSVENLVTIQPSPDDQVAALLGRLQDINPADMAQALCTLEFHNKINDFFPCGAAVQMDQTKLYFSRGLKDEVQSIYRELAQQLRARAQGSVQLMEAVFVFLSKTLREVVRVNHFVSNN